MAEKVYQLSYTAEELDEILRGDRNSPGLWLTDVDIEDTGSPFILNIDNIIGGAENKIHMSDLVLTPNKALFKIISIANSQITLQKTNHSLNSPNLRICSKASAESGRVSIYYIIGYDSSVIQAGDLILFSNGKIGRIISMSEDIINYELVGVTLTGTNILFTSELLDNNEYISIATIEAPEGQEIRVNDLVIGADSIMKYITVIVNDTVQLSNNLVSLKGETGENGLSMWVSNLELDGTIVFKSQIQTIEGREIQVGDLILFNDGTVGKITQIRTGSVVVEDTGINLKAVLSEADKEALKTEIIDDILASIEIAEGNVY